AYLLRTRDEVNAIVKRFLADDFHAVARSVDHAAGMQLAVRANIDVEQLRTDCAGEFTSYAYTELLHDNGTRSEYSQAYCRLGPTPNTPMELRSATSACTSLAPPDQTAHELLTLHKPSNLDLPPYGCRAYVVDNHSKDSTFSPRALAGMVADRSVNVVGAYRMWMPRLHRFRISSDVRFMTGEEATGYILVEMRAWLLLLPCAECAVRSYFASCVKGMEPVLANELRHSRLGASDVEEGHLGVHFTGSPQTGGRAVLWLRSAIRVMEELSWCEGVVHSDQLYEFARESVEWADMFSSKKQTLSVGAICGAARAMQSGRARPGDWECVECNRLVFANKEVCFACGAPKPAGGGLTHSHFSALTVKNAVCDSVRDAHGWRPSVDTSDADVPLFLYLHQGRATLYRVSSGSGSMHKRGYRTGVIHAGALRETTAAGLLLHSGYKPEEQVMCDPMAGSGTLAVEAALIATDTAPGLLRTRPPLARQGWLEGEMAQWESLLSEARSLQRPQAPLPILANDMHDGAINLAKSAARAAGVSSSISFSQSEVAHFVPSEKPHLVVSNPPWDLRLEGGDGAWSDLGGFLKRECGGSVAWLLSGEKKLTSQLRMRSSEKKRVESGGLNLLFLRYDVLPPKRVGEDSSEVSGGRKTSTPRPVQEAHGLAPEKAAEGGSELMRVEGEGGFVAGEERNAFGMGETETELVVGGTEKVWERLTVAELKEELRARGLPLSGLKAQLVERLNKNEVEQPPLPTRKDLDKSIKDPTDDNVIVMADGTGLQSMELEDMFASLYD
ncbi:MAG: hypothetical protein SGPRY_007357, partial [Prymnesium sp.]